MPDQTTGLLQILRQGGGFLRDPAVSLQPTSVDVFVPQKLITAHALVEGATVSGPTAQGTKNDQLTGVTSVCGLPPEQFAARIRC